MTNKELLEDLLIEFDELDMQPMLVVPDPLDRAKAWKHELTYAIKHLKAEVAREIFAEIKKAIKEEARDYCNGFEKAETRELQDWYKTKQDTAIFLYMKIDHLEKKYTEEKE